MLHQPCTFAGMQCINHACRSATATCKFFPGTGIPTDAFFKYYKALAYGQPGIIIMEHAFVEERGYAGHPQLGIHNDEMIQYHKDVIHDIKSVNKDIKVISQLAHAGFWSTKPGKLNVNTMAENDFNDVAEAFSKAAIRAQLAGYDAIQLHAGHTYLLSQSISTFYNQRNDKFKANDFLFLRQVFQAVKKATTLPVGVKLQCDDFLENIGMTPEQALKILENIRFDFMEITGGGFKKPHYFSPFREKIGGSFYYENVLKLLSKDGILHRMPVIITGGMTEEWVEHALSRGAAMIGFGRQFIRDERFLLNGWKNKCIHCNYCVQHFNSEYGLECIFKHKDRVKQRNQQKKKQHPPKIKSPPVSQRAFQHDK